MSHVSPSRNQRERTLLKSAQGVLLERRLVLPEVLEPLRRQLGVAYGVHDILVPEVMLEGSRVTPIVGELVAARVPEHMWMYWELKLGSDCQTRKQLSKARRRHRGPALGHEHVAAATILALEGSQAPHLLPTELLHAGDAVLGQRLQ